jgi:hypothetical protein
LIVVGILGILIVWWKVVFIAERDVIASETQNARVDINIVVDRSFVMPQILVKWRRFRIDRSIEMGRRMRSIEMGRRMWAIKVWRMWAIEVWRMWAIKVWRMRTVEMRGVRAFEMRLMMIEWDVRRRWWITMQMMMVMIMQ